MSQIFEEFVASLNEHNVRYLIIGGWAAGFHGYPRFTKDIDVLIERTDRNAAAARDAIYGFFKGRPPESIDPRDDLMNPEQVLQLGMPPNRIDLLSDVPGIDNFGAAWRRRARGRIGSSKASFASLKDLLASKRAAGRPQDLADVAMLERRASRPSPTKKAAAKSNKPRKR